MKIFDTIMIILILGLIFYIGFCIGLNTQSLGHILYESNTGILCC
jgi:hypothetical protein